MPMMLCTSGINLRDKLAQTLNTPRENKISNNSNLSTNNMILNKIIFCISCKGNKRSYITQVQFGLSILVVGCSLNCCSNIIRFTCDCRNNNNDHWANNKNYRSMPWWIHQYNWRIFLCGEWQEQKKELDWSWSCMSNMWQ